MAAISGKVLTMATPKSKHFITHLSFGDLLQNAVRRCSSSSNDSVTLENIFSEGNKARCKNLFSDIHPIRSKSWIKGREIKAQAAVLVPFCLVDGQPSVVFTKRSQRLLSHRGQISFPGGKVDQDDKDRINTAIRESEEEIGLDPDMVDVWGNMHPVPGKDMEISVTPIVGFCGELDVSQLVLNKDEVSEIFTYPIEALCEPSNMGYTYFRGQLRDYRLPVFTYGPHRVWGLTAIILHMVLTVLSPGMYSYPYSLP